MSATIVEFLEGRVLCTSGLAHSFCCGQIFVVSYRTKGCEV